MLAEDVARPKSFPFKCSCTWTGPETPISEYSLHAPSPEKAAVRKLRLKNTDRLSILPLVYEATTGGNGKEHKPTDRTVSRRLWNRRTVGRRRRLIYPGDRRDIQPGKENIIVTGRILGVDLE
jgi:hypothetical protein